MDFLTSFPYWGIMMFAVAIIMVTLPFIFVGGVDEMFLLSMIVYLVISRLTSKRIPESTRLDRLFA
ncbi:MAG: hypothetical protein QGD92_05240 [Gammaproteobacteria bacterium]|nr:hypothetical protein [Gammaproteobacteria bacterium]